MNSPVKSSSINLAVGRMDAMTVKGDPTHARQGTISHVSTEKEEGYSSSGYPTTAHAATRTFVRSASSVGPAVDDLRAISTFPPIPNRQSVSCQLFASMCCTI